MNQTPTADYLDWLVRDAGLVELCQIDRGLDVGWYDRADHLLHDARVMAGSGNLFTTVNRLDRDGLSAYLADSRRADPNRKLRTPDDAVVRYCRLFFDFDPERPTDCSSTADELAEAEVRARSLARRLAALGWPAPALAMSGNGWHLQYRTALPKSREVREQLATIYSGLHRELSDAVVQFDRSVRNPARLCALYGSVKRKGPNTLERPHRRSWVQIPTDWRQVHPRQVAALADSFARQCPREPASSSRCAPRISGKGDYGTLNIIAWFAAHEAYVGHLTGIKHGVRCPWSAEHTTSSPKNGGDAIVFEADGGWPGFHCAHAHCAGRNIRDVMVLWGDADSHCGRELTRGAGRA